MASVQQKGNGWYCRFLHNGKRYTFAVGAVSQDEAEAKAAHVDYLLMRLKQRLATLPSGMHIVEYVQFDGKELQKPEDERPVTEKLGLETFKDRYLNVFEKNLEVNTVKGIKQHFGHLIRHLGPRFPIADLSLADLQGYADQRAKAKGNHGRRLSGGTIRKELISLRTAWNWGTTMKLVSGKFPNKGISFPKTTQKPAFMTRAEIERRIRTSKLTKAEMADLWDSLYLTVDEVGEFLAFVKTKPAQPFLYPILCFVGHTGCRRSEATRTRIPDVDFEGRAVTIHEKKRVRGKLTTRRVPLSEFLIAVLKEWLEIHPGGEWLFCQSAKVVRSKTRRGEISPLTESESSDHFDRVIDKEVADSTCKWKHLRGYHVLRHSFISALASNGIDQRIIDDCVGHQSEEQRKRYRHLYPSVKENAITQVFG